MHWDYLFSAMWGAVSFLLGGWWERWMKRKDMPYTWTCLVPGCGFHIKASDANAVMKLADQHDEFGHGE